MKKNKSIYAKLKVKKEAINKVLKDKYKETPITASEEAWLDAMTIAKQSWHASLYWRMYTKWFIFKNDVRYAWRIFKEVIVLGIRSNMACMGKWLINRSIYKHHLNGKFVLEKQYNKWLTLSLNREYYGTDQILEMGVGSHVDCEGSDKMLDICPGTFWHSHPQNKRGWGTYNKVQCKLIDENTNWLSFTDIRILLDHGKKTYLFCMKGIYEFVMEKPYLHDFVRPPDADKEPYTGKQTCKINGIKRTLVYNRITGRWKDEKEKLKSIREAFYKACKGPKI